MFKEIYFWMYSYLSGIKTNKTPAFNSYVIICLFQLLNIGTFIVLINFFFKTNNEKTLAIFIGPITMCVLYVLNYFYLYTKREEIFEKYRSVLPKRRIKGQLFFWIYILLSLTIFFVEAANLVS